MMYGMTLEEQIGQLLMVGFWGTTPSQEIIDLIQRYHVGNILLFSRNVGNAQQVLELTESLQMIAKEAGQRYPLLIAIDQENGIVQRLGGGLLSDHLSLLSEHLSRRLACIASVTALVKNRRLSCIAGVDGLHTEAATIFPGNMALGAIGSEEVAYKVARASGRELKALGINMNLAPVVDVNNNPANPVIGVRSFGEDPQLVARLGAAMVKGYHEAGIFCCL